MANAASKMTAEPMLTPGEIRTAPAQNSGWKVSVYNVAGGSFTHVRVVDALGVTAYSHSYQFETDALARFAELKSS